MKLNTKVIFRSIYRSLLTFLFLVAIGLVISYFQLPGGLRTFFVLSGSMSPKIPTGSLIFVRPSSDNVYNVGDVVTYKSLAEKDNPRPEFTTTHRIIQIDDRPTEGKIYITKGDANDAKDWQGVQPDLVLGKVVFHLPFLGSFIAFARTKEGLVLLIIIPATILIFSEITSIREEIRKLITKRNHPDEAPTH